MVYLQQWKQQSSLHSNKWFEDTSEKHTGALCKRTLTHSKVWMLRSPWERDDVETIHSHLQIYFTGIKRYPASLCCWEKTNHIPRTLPCVYICLLVVWWFSIKWEELQDTETLKKVKGQHPFWHPIPSLRCLKIYTEIQTSSLDVQSRQFLEVT